MKNTTSYGSPESLLPEMLEYLSRGEGFWLVVTGNSMYPTLLHESDSVFIEPLMRGLRVGDIPLVLAGDCHCVLHRVIKIDLDTFLMQGDALWSVEGPVPMKCIIGVATLRRRRGKVKTLARHQSVFVVTWRLWTKGKAWGIQAARKYIPKSLRKRANDHMKNTNSQRK